MTKMMGYLCEGSSDDWNKKTVVDKLQELVGN